MVWLTENQSNASELSTVSNGDLLARLAIPGPKALHGFHNLHAIFHLAKDHMLAIQPGTEEQALPAGATGKGAAAFALR